MQRLRLSRSIIAAATIVLPCALPLAASAALIDRGNGLIYDTDRNITWLSDADLLATQRAADPLLIGKIIAAVPLVFDGRTNHVVTALDFGASGSSRPGLATWYGAKAWADYLVFDGYSDWRLPTSKQPDANCSTTRRDNSTDSDLSFGFNCTGSELGHLFYDELGGRQGVPLSAANGHAASFNLFTDVETDYWTATTYLASASAAQAWFFDVNDQGQSGSQDKLSIEGQFQSLSYSWLVRTGDIGTVAPPSGAVPEPGIQSLLLIGVGVFVGSRRRGTGDRRLRSPRSASA